MRYKLLELAPEVIRKSSTLQRTWKTKSFEQMKANSRREYRQVEITYYEFIAALKNNRVKVVVKQIENGKKFFLSIIPVWKKGRNGKPRNLGDGNGDEY